MPNPFTRGSAPGRARDASQRSGSFKPGHESRGRRKKGTPNKISRATKQTLLEVADCVGSDGNGKDGVVGYFTWLAKYHPKVFLAQLGRLLVYETPQNCVADIASDTPPAFELNETLRKSIELKLRGRPPADPRLFEDLVHLSVEAPESFARMLGAALLTPPSRTR